MNAPAQRILPLALLALALAATSGCNNATTSTSGKSTAAVDPSEDPKQVVATFDGVTLTLADVDKPIRGQLAAMESEYREQRHKLRQAGVESLIVKKLVEKKAKAAGKSEEEFLKGELEAALPAVTPDEAKAFYEQNAAKMPAPFEALQEQIVQHLTNEKRRTVYLAYFEKLKSEAGAKITLPEPEAPLVEVAADGPSKGAPNAPVTIIEFSDFECPFCSRALPGLEQVMAAYPGQVRIVFRDFPLSFHPKAQKASEAGQCALEQGKFWEMHDRLFANQDKLDVPDLKEHAKALGLDAGKFDTCLDSGRMADAVKKHMDAGEEAGVSGTPAFFVNGRMIAGALPFEEFKKVIDRELQRKGLGATVAAPK